MPLYKISVDRTSPGLEYSVEVMLKFPNVHEARKMAWSLVPAIAGEYVAKIMQQITPGWTARKGFTAVVESRPKP